MTYKKLLFTTFAIIGSVLLAQPNRASAAEALPPALQAAVQSGNSAAIKQAINTLSGGNAARAAALALQVATAAEGMLATNPQAAVSVAAAAVGVIQSSSQLMKMAPQQALDVATIAGRIIGNADAQRAAPQAVANLAASVAQVVTNPVVYAASPAAALQAMTNAYAATASDTVLAAAPGARGNVAEILGNLANSLSLADPGTAAKISAILGGQSSGNQQYQSQQPGAARNDATTNQTTPPFDPNARNVSPF